MPKRSEEEKQRRRELNAQKKAAREEKKQKELQEAQQREQERLEKERKLQQELDSIHPRGSDDGLCYLHSLADDSLQNICSFLNASSLGNFTMTNSAFREALPWLRNIHLFSRVATQSISNSNVANNIGRVDALIQMFLQEEEVTNGLLVSALEGCGDTGRLIAKSVKGAAKKTESAKTADEYIAYGRFVEEALCGYSVQKSRENPTETTFLPPIVNGRFASASPEHSLCRFGGDGEKCGGCSGVCSWGVGKRGQLGNGKREDESEPFRLLGGIGYGIRIVQVSAGGGLVRVAHSLLLTDTGRVLSFGNAQYGQLGHGYDAGNQLPDVLRPKYIEYFSHVQCTCVSAGELHSAVTTSDGDLYTWGDAFCGQLGHGDRRPQLLPKQVTKGDLDDEVISVVCCGARQSLALTEEGDVFSFGLGLFGVLGRSFTPYEYHSDAVAANLGEDEDVIGDGGPAAAAAAIPVNNRQDNAFEIDESMRINIDLIANLTLDDGSDQCIPKKIEVLDGIRIVAISAGHRHSMFLDKEGTLYTCGSGKAGELGHGDNQKQEFPMRVKEFESLGTQVIQMSAGVDMSMAVTSSGEVFSWGKTKGGRIGLNAPSSQNEDVSIPRRVYLVDKNGCDLKAVDVECGYVHSLIVGLNGSLHLCGGVGTDGQEDGQLDRENEGRPTQLENFSIWHRLAEPREVKTSVKWKKYGKYELKGRRSMMSD